MNRLQSAIIWLAVLEIILCCFSMPVFMFRMQEAELSKELEGEAIMSVNLSTRAGTVLGETSLSIEQKIDMANSYDNTVTTIPINKGEVYTANQICSIGARELEKITQYYAQSSPLMARLQELELIESLRGCGLFLEGQSNSEGEDTGYADVETVDEVDVDIDSIYINGYNEVSVSSMMYVNSAEPEQTFIVWQISYYNLEDDTTVLLNFDDDSGKLLSITGSISDFGGEGNYSLYIDMNSNAEMFKEYYQMEDDGLLQITEE